MFETLKSAFRVKEMRRKLLYLLVMIFIIRIGSQLPIPGVDSSVFKQWFKSNTGDAFNFLMLSPAALLRVCLYLR